MKLLVFDGNSIFNRAFYGVKLLSTKEGFYTNAIYGFLNILNKVKDEVEPDAIAIAFDMRAPTFRHKKFDGYKKNRKGMPEELAMQFPVLKELLGYLGYKLVECEGFEADDILGTLADACEKSNNECIIATGDRDSLQLISDKVCVRLTATKFGRPEVTLYDKSKIMHDYGVEPSQLIDIKALQGDASDSIPGVAGIGQKGASDLIVKFKNIENIYDNIDNLDIKDGIKKKLVQSKDMAYLSKELGTIVKDVPIDRNIESYIPKKPDETQVSKLMTELEMFSLMNKMGIEKYVSDDKQLKMTEDSISKVKVIVNEDKEVLINLLRNVKEISIVGEYKFNKLEQLAFAIDECVYIIDDLNKYFDLIKFLIENEKIKIYTHDFKKLSFYLKTLNIELCKVYFDTALAAYLLNPSEKEYSIKRLSEEYGVSGRKIIGIEENYKELAEDASLLYDLSKKLKEKIDKNSKRELLYDIEIPLSKVLADMEYVGFLVDRKGIENYGEILEESMNEIQSEIYDCVGTEFNINSPKQLGIILFEEMGLPKGKKTKSGYSTSAKVLESIKGVHPVIELILKYRAIFKLKSTYCDGMVKVIGEDGRIHSIFNQTETRTGRISSAEPNLQNIPVRTKLGKELRKFFCARKDCLLVDADYSQIELRILAHISNDNNMINAFKENLDIHSMTASQVFNIPIELVNPILRNRAKAVNFGIVYGISAFSLAKDIGVTRKEADSYIKRYLANYSGVDSYMNDVIKKAKTDGFVETIFGRRRYLPELSSSSFNVRSFGERVARNMPIQGAAADIIKIAMINVDKRIKKENLESKLILQVHDELIIEAPKSEVNEVSKILKEEMESAASLRVPLVVDINIGNTWYEAKS